MEDSLDSTCLLVAPSNQTFIDKLSATARHGGGGGGGGGWGHHHRVNERGHGPIKKLYAINWYAIDHAFHAPT